jgi:hypothetical protein
MQTRMLGPDLYNDAADMVPVGGSCRLSSESSESVSLEVPTESTDIITK